VGVEGPALKRIGVFAVASIPVYPRYEKFEHDCCGRDKCIGSISIDDGFRVVVVVVDLELLLLSLFVLTSIAHSSRGKNME